MRVSTDTLRSAFMTALDSAQRRVIDTQEKLSSGQRVNKPSDDPVAAARVAHLDASLSRLDQFQQNSVFARNQLGLEEASLTSVVDNLQRARELALQGNNSTASDDDRKVISDEIAQIRDSLISLANTTDVDGRHLFSGYNEAAAPFVKSASGAIVYNGDQGQRTLQISDSRFVAINDSGAEVFQRVPQGNGTFVVSANSANTGTGTLGETSVTDVTAWVRDTYTVRFLTPTSYEVRDSANALVTSGTYTDGQSVAFRGIELRIDGTPAAGDTFTAAPSASRDIFGMLDDMIAALKTPATDSAGRAQMHSNLGQRIADMDSAMSHIVDVRGEIGARVRALDQQDSLNADFTLHLKSTLSSVRDLDYAEALSKLSQQLLGLDAAQKSFAETQNLSLFRYL